jgi:ribonucleoside-diphosphate reductase alpha chain
VGKNEAIYNYLKLNHPELLEDDYFKPHNTAQIVVPQKAPEGSILRSEKALELLERIKLFSTQWVKAGHRKGQNTHNVSATVNIRDDEWEEVGEWMWENRACYNGLAVLPHDGGSYKQTPFEECDELTYTRMMKSLNMVKLENVVEIEDNTDLQGELACAGGSCEIV